MIDEGFDKLTPNDEWANPFLVHVGATASGVSDRYRPYLRMAPNRQ